MVTRIDWGSMRGEVDRFEQYLREVKQASENTVQSYRRDLMQMITYLEEKEIREEFDAIHVHQTEISRYDKAPGKCRIRIQLSLIHI